jgi:hypothetical protein
LLLTGSTPAVPADWSSNGLQKIVRYYYLHLLKQQKNAVPRSF